MAYHRVGNTYITTEEAVRHSTTLFALAVAMCTAGAAALGAYLLLHDQPFLKTHAELAKGAYAAAGIVGFLLGVRYCRLILLGGLVILGIGTILSAAQSYLALH